MPEVSMLMHVDNVLVVDFDICRFGHPDKGPTRMLTNSLPEPQATSSKGNRHEASRQRRLGSPRRRQIVHEVTIIIDSMVLMTNVNINDFYQLEEWKLMITSMQKRKIFNLCCDYHYLVAFGSQYRLEASGAVLCKVIHASTEDQMRLDQDTTIEYFTGDEFNR